MKAVAWELFDWGWEGKLEEEKEVPFKDMPTLKNAVVYLSLTVIGKIHMTFSGVRILLRNYMSSVHLSNQFN